MHENGRVLIHADAPEWREAVAEMFGRDAVAPPDVLEATVRALAGWRSTWSARPEVVVDLPAAGFRALTGSVADHIASVGRLERASLPVPPPRDDLRDLSSADEAAWWRDQLDPAGMPSDAVAGRSVLLVVDASSSMWPVTVAAAALRRAGATAVLPLLLHRRP
jgi:ATP-dependent DNA helicase RecQ